MPPRHVEQTLFGPEIEALTPESDAVTESVALADSTTVLLQASATVALYEPASEGWAFVMASVVARVPVKRPPSRIGAPSFDHWKVGQSPVAETVKLAASPWQTDWLVG